MTKTHIDWSKAIYGNPLFSAKETTVSKPADGTYIYLWDCDNEEYVYGHLTKWQFDTVITNELGTINTGPIESKATFQIYGRWSCDASSEYGRVLEEYKDPGRGRFKITKGVY